MNFNPALIISALSGVIYVITGWLMQRYPPKKINDLYGYRTKRSKKSQKHWEFAQIESAKHLKQAGYYCLLSCAPYMLLEFDVSHIWIAMSFVTLIPFISIIQTEKALKNRFEV